jgi:hypothetical protein
MPIVAICSSSACDCRVPLGDAVESAITPIPPVCPDCGASPMIWLCPNCGFLVVDLPGCDPEECQACCADIRASFQRLHQGRVH